MENTSFKFEIVSFAVSLMSIHPFFRFEGEGSLWFLNYKVGDILLLREQGKLNR